MDDILAETTAQETTDLNTTQQMYAEAARAIESAKRITAFTGAGISVESGIPPFRGEGGLWQKYDPVFIEIGYFHQHQKRSWELIKEVFYDFFGEAEPNAAHEALAELEQRGLLQAIITQNIDNLHQAAGSKEVHEFHGTSQYLECVSCSRRYHVSEVDLIDLPPLCTACGSLLKPAFVFFGEDIPEPARSKSFAEAQLSDLFILIGTTGEIMPAGAIPHLAKQHGARIIEVNPQTSSYTTAITDIFLQEVATVAMLRLLDALR